MELSENAQVFQDLINSIGLPQPRCEPQFFVHPVGYDLVTPGTSYNTLFEGTAYSTRKDTDAKLESSS